MKKNTFVYYQGGVLADIEKNAQRLYNECKQGHITRGQLLQEIFGLVRSHQESATSQIEAARIMNSMDHGTDFLAWHEASRKQTEAAKQPLVKGPTGLINRVARMILYLAGYSVTLGEMSGPGDHSLDGTWDFESDIQDDVTGWRHFTGNYEHARHPYYHLKEIKDDFEPATLCGIETARLSGLPADGETYRPCPKCVAAMNVLAQDRYDDDLPESASEPEEDAIEA